MLRSRYIKQLHKILFVHHLLAYLLVVRYTWDVRNRLSAITGFKSDCSALSASFKYDAVGRRIEKTINGATTKYLYDGLDIIQEIVGTAKTNYIRALNIDEPLTRIKADGTVRHYVVDALGSVIALTDDAGVVKTTYTYDPFGNVTITGEASDNPFQYTDRENDGTGLYYYRARFYSPELQRWISEDPIRLTGGINFYSYVGNNPVNYMDPTGLVCGSGPTDPFLPDKYWGYDFTGPCKKHDTCYGTCGKSKTECDLAFLDNMKKMCQGLTGYWLFDCKAAAYTYYAGVVVLGDIPYFLTQKKKCCK